jgi:hypothetical protein
VKLFTFVVDYQGGTYIAQDRGIDVIAAAQGWSRALERLGDIQLTSEDRRLLEKDLVSDGASPISDTDNVWCLTSGLRDQLVMVHAVLTAEVDPSVRTIRGSS